MKAQIKSKDRVANRRLAIWSFSRVVALAPCPLCLVEPRQAQIKQAAGIPMYIKSNPRFWNCMSVSQKANGPSQGTVWKVRVGRISLYELVAGDGFCSLLVRLGGGAVAIGMTVSIAVAIHWSDANRLARVREISRHRLGDVTDGANLHNRRLRLLQHQLFVNRANLGLLFVSLLAASALFFRRSHRDVVFQVANAGSVFRVNLQGMLEALKVDGLALGIDFMLAVRLVPLGHGRVLMHVLDDLPPAHAGVVRAEADLALLRRVRNDAHFRAAEVIVEQILEPHPRDEQEVPGILLAALHGIFVSALGGSPAILLLRALGQRPGLVKLLEEVIQLQPLRPLERVVVLQEGHGHHE